MTGRFKTLTLIEEAELDRLRQKQIKDYNPSLNSMVKIQSTIDKVFDDPELSDEEKQKVLNTLHERFNFLFNKFKLKGQAALSAPVVTIPQPAVPAPRDLIPAVAAPAAVCVNNLGADLTARASSISGDESGTETEGVSELFSASDPMSQQPKAIPSQEQLKLPNTYAKKFTQFSDFLNRNSGSISYNDNDEIVLDGTPIPHSSYHDLIRAMYIRKRTMNLTGITNLYEKLSDLKADISMISHKDARASLESLSNPTIQSSLDKSSCSTSTTQSGTGAKSNSKRKIAFRHGIKSYPPGKNPKLLHVYRI